MTVGVWFFSEPNNRDYYDLFEIGVDVIITDYPIRVANQLKLFYSNNNYLEGCKSIEKTPIIYQVVNHVNLVMN